MPGYVQQLLKEKTKEQEQYRELVAKDVEVKKLVTQVKSKKPVKQAKSRELEKLKLKGSDDTSVKGHSPDALYSTSEGGPRVQSFLVQAAEALVEGKGSSHQCSSWCDSNCLPPK
nr:hypothetical protein CFP56_35703 [Quercus suber]